jgi:hypothetical protein
MEIDDVKENPYTPNPDCEKCTKDNIACISHYMLAGGYND